MPRSKISAAELAVIIDHLDDMIDAATTGLLLQRSVPRKERNAIIIGQIAYWRNAISAFKWAKSLAYQRGGHIHGGIREPIQQSGVDTGKRGGNLWGLLAKAKADGVRYAKSIGQEIRTSDTGNAERNSIIEHGRNDSRVDDGQGIQKGGD